MKHLKFICLVLLTCLTFLFGSFFIFRSGYKKYNIVEESALEEILSGKGAYDIVFIGSSRTYYHIHPRIIDSITGLNSYNAGVKGANLLEMNMLLKCYLQTHPAPKTIVIDLPVAAFDVESKPIFNPNVYYPFLDNDIVFNTLKPYRKVRLLKYLPFFQLTELDDFMRQGAITGIRGKQLYRHSDFYKGHLQSGVDTIALPFARKYDSMDLPVSEKGKLYLKQIIETCRSNNIRLVMLYPPDYAFPGADVNPQFFPTIQKFSRDHGVSFLNYRHIAISSNHLLFRDELHLNENGAMIFSTILAGDLKNTL